MFHFTTARHPELGTKVLTSTVMNGPMSSSGEHVCDPHEEQAGRASREHDPELRRVILTSDLDIRRGSTRPSVTPTPKSKTTLDLTRYIKWTKFTFAVRKQCFRSREAE